MACFTPLPALLCPPKDPFTPPTGAVVPVVYDTETEETRPIANGESFPGYQCVDAQIVEGEFPPTHQLLNIYKNLQERIKELERKFCDCLCTECPECPECPELPYLLNIPVYTCGYNPEEPDFVPEIYTYVNLYAVPQVIDGDNRIGVLIAAASDYLSVDQEAYMNDWTFMSGSATGTYTHQGNAVAGTTSLTAFSSITHLNILGGPCEGT